MPQWSSVSQWRLNKVKVHLVVIHRGLKRSICSCLIWRVTREALSQRAVGVMDKESQGITGPYGWTTSCKESHLTKLCALSELDLVTACQSTTRIKTRQSDCKWFRNLNNAQCHYWFSKCKFFLLSTIHDCKIHAAGTSLFLHHVNGDIRCDPKRFCGVDSNPVPR